MRLRHVFVKSLREMRRDLLVLALTLVFAPVFVVIYWLSFGQAATVYDIVVVNQDMPVVTGDEEELRGGDDLVTALGLVEGAGGGTLVTATMVDDVAAAERAVVDREAVAALVIPGDFSSCLAAVADGASSTGGESAAQVVMSGDLTNYAYSVAAVVAAAVVDQYVREVTGQDAPVQMVERALEGSAKRTDFETSVPGILVFAVVMLVFLAAMTIAREVEAGTMRRLQMTRMTTFELLGGMSAALVLVGAVSVMLTFGVALALGFDSRGPIWVAILVGAITAIAVIGCGLITAAFSKTVAQAFVIANFPLGLLMFFSGCMFPIPKTELFEIAGHGVGAFDLLAPTHAVIALNKVLTLGAGLGGVLWELVWLVVLSAVYFVAGVGLFKRLRMRPA
ncbi:MAG: ABC transporter permease [Thermoleophilia bacterium]|nr:ABC transporter permease [Thermoleophilia bacterium]